MSCCRRGNNGHPSSSKCGSAAQHMQEIEDEAMGAFHNVFDAMQWGRNQRVWVFLLTHGEAWMLCEVVNMYGEPQSMTGPEL